MNELLARPELRANAERRLTERSRPEGECIVWTGYTHVYPRNWQGPGLITITHARCFSVPRVAWVVRHGPIPEGMHVLHRCDNPPCFRDEHLFLGTHAENMADMIAKGRARGHPKPTHCLRSHAFDEANTYVTKDGRRRICRACARLRRKAVMSS